MNGNSNLSMGYGNSGTSMSGGGNAVPNPIHDVPLGRPHPTHPLAPVR